MPNFNIRFALAACYENTVESKNFLDSTKWRAKYVYDDDIVRYISIENFKRTNSMELDNHDFTITVHTSIPFVKESIGKDNDELKLLLLAKVRQLLPGLPLIPLHTYLQFWDTSQVSTPLSSNKLFEVIGMEDLIGERVAESASKIVLAGDYFSNSNFEGCLKSARAAADYILSRN